MAKRVVVSRTAYLTIDEIVEFNNERNQSSTYSRKFLISLFRQFKIIKRFPLIGIRTSRENTYVLVWNQFYIYYSFTDDMVEILSVYHQKENIQR